MGRREEVSVMTQVGSEYVSASVTMKSCQCVWLLVLESCSIFSCLTHYRHLSCTPMALAMVGEHFSTLERKLYVLCWPRTAESA